MQNTGGNLCGFAGAGTLKNPAETVFTGFSEAEVIKLFVNTYPSLRVSYFNMLDTYAEIKSHNTAKIIHGV